MRLFYALFALALMGCATFPKIATVNVQQVLNNVGDGKRAVATISKEFEPKRVEIAQNTEKLKVLSGKQLAEQKKKITEAKDTLKAEIAKKTADATAVVWEKLAIVLERFVKENGYLLVLNDKGANLVYSAPSLDITGAVIKEYDLANPRPVTNYPTYYSPEISDAKMTNTPK